MSDKEPILVEKGDKEIANEAYDYARFALMRYGIEVEDEQAQCDFILAIVKYMKSA